MNGLPAMEQNMLNQLEYVVGKITTILSWIAYVAIFLMAVQVSASVLSRWIFGWDIPVTTELATYYYMVALTYLPLAIVDRKNRHLYAEFFYVLMPKRLQRFIDIINSTLAVAFLGFLSWRTAVDAIDRTKSADVISTTYGLFAVWPARWIVPVGLAVACAAALFRVFQAVREAVNNGAHEAARLGSHEEGEV